MGGRQLPMNLNVGTIQDQFRLHTVTTIGETPNLDNMGKVHGSLARAGKVKSQTPKVEKQEKKKTPKGRAKKRMLYNRRFVNVTTLPGGKRRMNPNPEK
ncbi:hypothetical protein PAXRUDRAFT_829414 [Paxillus rubicundulus Ve08.2h10]|uniref:Uncharacterized protein n=6 Tax=Agaricomycetes TaxID=155619 RepID=A0A0D0E605_9AGAM|nr:hypothetical protein PAXRUDRAFT_829414 [Paxillus rubicundulus Ve08.2h10]